MNKLYCSHCKKINKTEKDHLGDIYCICGNFIKWDGDHIGLFRTKETIKAKKEIDDWETSKTYVCELCKKTFDWNNHGVTGIGATTRKRYRWCKSCEDVLLEEEERENWDYE